MNSIKISQKVWKILMTWRVDLGCKSIDDLLDRMIKLVKIHKMKDELQESGK